MMEKLRIIDAHVHLGYDHVYDAGNTIDKILEGMDKNKVEVSLVQPFTVFYEEDCIKDHNAIFDVCKKYRGRFFGICCPNPHLTDDFVSKEISRCVRELNFVGIKLNTQAHAVNPFGKDGMKIFKLSVDFNIPVIVHTGSGAPFSLPSSLIPVIEEYPKVKIVVAHAGQMYPDEALILAKKYDNFYLETTWTPITTIKRFINEIGSHRIIFGSDHIENIPIELEKFYKLGLNLQDLKNCLEENTKKLFKIKI